MKKHTFAKRCTEIAVVVVAIMVLLGLAFFVAGRFLGKRSPALLVCTTEVCSKYADMFDNNINDDVEPCDNFYRHVCAPQVRKQAKATFETLRDNHFIKVWEYLAGVEVVGKEDSALEKAARYLQSCNTVLNVTGTQEVKDVLRKGGITWPDPTSHSLELLDGIFYMSARVFKPVFFSVTVKKSQQPPTVELSLDPEFISVLDMVYRRKTTKRLQGHFRLVYADFASPEVAKNETRRSELLNDVDEIGAHFKNVSNYSLSRHKWERAQVKPGDITTLAPSTTYAMWEAAFARYFPDQPFNSVASIVVNHVEYFKAVFQTLAVFGASRMLNYFSWLCVQSLVHYTSIEMLSSYYSSMHEAIRNHKKYCVADTYSHFRFAINVHSWQNVPESSLEYVHRLADTIWEAFGKSLQDKGRKLTGHKEPPPKEPFTSKLFQHHTLCKPEKVRA